jgi:hypothetical protein
MGIYLLYIRRCVSTSVIYPDLGNSVSSRRLFTRKFFFCQASFRWLVLLCALILSACAAPPTLAPTPTFTPAAPTDTPTPTIVWFPATATYTPFPIPTLQPTLDQRPGIGDLVFSDDFSDPSAWLESRTSEGSVAVTNHELTIAIAENNERAYLYSVRTQPIYKNFYLEITASPSLCREKDEYGLLLRVASDADYYRLSLACDGNIRLDRLVGGNASSPQPWVLSGSVPPGAPSTALIGVWAYGDEMRFFVNNEYQFTVRDPSLGSGGFGVFARAAGDMAVTVNFSDMNIYEITGPPPASPTDTPTVTPTPQ